MKRYPYLSSILVLLCFVAGASGCGGDTPATVPVRPVPLESFSLDPPDGSDGVPVTAVVKVRFHRSLVEGSAPVLEIRAARGADRRAGGKIPQRQVRLRDERTLVLYPQEDLAPAAMYEVWLAEDPASLPESAGGLPALLTRFRTSGVARSDTAVVFDPLDASRLTPYPGDLHCRPDADTPTGMRRAVSESLRPFNIRAGELERADGFSAFPRIALPLTGPVHGRFAAMGLDCSKDPSGPLFLVNADPGSPGSGERVALLMEEDPFGASLRRPEHSLVVFPARPLRPGTAYALVVTRRLTDPDGGPVEASPCFRRIVAGDPDPALVGARRVIEPVLAFLDSPAFELPLPRKDLALVLPFTTRSTENLTGEMTAIRDFLLRTADEDPPRIWVESSSAEPPRASIPHEHIGRFVEGEVECRDFRGEDGLFDPDVIRHRPRDAPAVPLEFVLTLPRAATPERPAGLVVYLHGINDRKETVYNLSDVLARQNLASIAIDAVEHGSRKTNPDWDAWVDFLSIGDIARGRDNMRQTQADLLCLTRAVREGLNRALGEPLVATERVVFVGFSLGGILGAGYVALDPAVQGAALIVMGGPFTEVAVRNSILEPGEPLFFLLANLLGVLPGSVAELLGAAAGLNQEIIDPGDPISYVPYLNGLALGGEAARKDILLIQVMDDTTMANRTTENMARGVGAEIVRPVLRAVAGLDAALAPLAGNRPGGATVGLVQFDRVTRGGVEVPADHGNIISTDEPRRVIAHFLSTSLERGQGEILSAYPGEQDRR